MDSSNQVQPLLGREIEISFYQLFLAVPDKTILNRLSGIITANALTFCMGPSGSGKTSLLTLLSGRVASKGLQSSGSVFVNGKSIKGIQKYSREIAYVMQDDILLAPLTVRESIRFAADLRTNSSSDQKDVLVQSLLDKLKLNLCADSRVGNNILRGVSGGQRKRTSIAVELITNPSVLFLDEPTTGLDSASALNVVQLLKDLSRSGKTVFSTIHQPSYHIYSLCDRLMLMMEGHIIFQGKREQAQSFFAQMSYHRPKFTSEAEHFMQVLNKEGLQAKSQQAIEEEYKGRVAKLQEQYAIDKRCKFTKTIFNEIVPKQPQIGTVLQIFYIFKRAVLCQARNPFDLVLKVVMGVVFALATFLVYAPLKQQPPFNYADIQNRLGILFFLVGQNVFGGIQGALAVMSSQRPVFLRERYGKNYGTASYFIGRVLAALTFDIIYPLLPLAIIYFHLDLNSGSGKFINAVLIVEAIYFASTGFGLMYSALIPKLETAMALTPLLIIPFLLLSGFFSNINNVPWIFYPLKIISPFRYGFQAMLYNEFTETPIPDYLNPTIINPLTPNSLEWNVLVLVLEGVVTRTLGLLLMYLVSSPKQVEFQQKVDRQ